MDCGWEGNRRSGVALVMRHRHMVLHLRAHGLDREMSTPPIPSRSVAQFTFYILIGGVLGLMEKRTRPSIRLLVRLGSMTSERKVLETSNWVEIFIFAHVTEVPIL